MTKNEKLTIPAWFKKDLSEISHANAKQALVNYIVKSKLRDNLPKAAISTTHAILPELGKLETKWNKVTPDNFNTVYKAHHRLNAIVYNTLATNGIANLLIKYDENLGEVDDEEEVEIEQEEQDKDQEQQVIEKSNETQIQKDSQILKPSSLDIAQITEKKILDVRSPKVGIKRPAMELASEALGLTPNAKAQKILQMDSLEIEIHHLREALNFKITQWRTLRNVVRPTLDTPKLKNNE